MQNLNNLLIELPDYAKDIRINIQNLINEQNQILNFKQIVGCVLASAFATKNESLTKIIKKDVQNILSDAEINAVKISASIMTMNNTYYRFVHLVGDKEYSQMQAGLRMKGIVDHGIEKNDFEIFSLAISIINGCGMCVEAHSNQLIKHGYSKVQIQMIAKIASVINSLAQALLIQNFNL